MQEVKQEGQQYFLVYQNSGQTKPIGKQVPVSKQNVNQDFSSKHLNIDIMNSRMQRGMSYPLPDIRETESEQPFGFKG